MTQLWKVTKLSALREAFPKSNRGHRFDRCADLPRQPCTYRDRSWQGRLVGRRGYRMGRPIGCKPLADTGIDAVERAIENANRLRALDGQPGQIDLVGLARWFRHGAKASVHSASVTARTKAGGHRLPACRSATQYAAPAGRWSRGRASSHSSTYRQRSGRYFAVPDLIRARQG